MNDTHASSAPIQAPAIDARAVAPSTVLDAIRQRSYATIGTTSAQGWPHAAGVLYGMSGEHLFVSTMRSSRKARNIAESGRVGVTIPVRRFPIGPPSSVQFQAAARVLDLDDKQLAAAYQSGDLKAVTGHGELELEGGCFLQIDLPRRLVTFGLGMSLLSLIRDPLDGAGIADRGPAVAER